MVSQKDTLKLEFPVPMYVILFGKRFFADVTKLRGAHSELGWALVHCGLPRWCSGKESASQCRRCRFDFLVGNIPWRRKEQPTPVFLPGKSHGQRNQVGYSPWGHKESDTTEHAHISPVTAMLIRKEKFLPRHTERRWPSEDRGREWSCAPTSQGC